MPGVPDLLQPVAHALLQARADASLAAALVSDDALWARPAGVASPGFHLQHLSGVVDRLFTYARGEGLSPAQLATLGAEGTPATTVTAASLSRAFDAQVEKALAQLRATPPASLTEPRRVGRAGLPSTVLGLLVHAAEHAQRHVGQLLVTARIVASGIGRA